MAFPSQLGRFRQFVLLVLLLGFWMAWHLWFEPKPAFKQWEGQIRAFEARDVTNAPPKQAVLLVGSSTIRLWNSARQDLGPIPVVRRGFGGAHISDITAYCERIIFPYQPRIVVVYGGDNDIAHQKPPRRVLADFRHLVERIHARQPGTKIIFVSIKPSLARWHLIQSVRRANALVRAYTAENPHLDFVDIFTPMLDEKGEPRPEFLAADGLHLSEEGYGLWAGVLRNHLGNVDLAAVE